MKFENLGQFNAKLRKWSGVLVPEHFDRVMTKIAADVLTGAIDLTPVETGRARGGWQLDVGHISESALGEPDSGGGATMERGMSRLRRASRGLAGKIIYIYNNVEYIVYLEFGTDKMAPFAMLRTAMTRATAGL